MMGPTDLYELILLQSFNERNRSFNPLEFHLAEKLDGLFRALRQLYDFRIPLRRVK